MQGQVKLAIWSSKLIPEKGFNSKAKNVFNRVFSCENAKKLWNTIIENHDGTEDVANERYHVLIDKFNSFKQLDDEIAKSMYSRLNTLVNEINFLGVKQIGETEVIRKTLYSL